MCSDKTGKLIEWTHRRLAGAGLAGWAGLAGLAELAVWAGWLAGLAGWLAGWEN
jgi:energy-converting hydrogenase Eha subunit G